jgi:hypothetical protein
VTTTLAEGAVVVAGDQIGTVIAGHCSSVCLHFGVRLLGEYLSPLNFLGGIPHSVLLPTRLPDGLPPVRGSPRAPATRTSRR